MEKDGKKKMMEHINPLYTVAMILAVVLILVILIGFVFVDWSAIWAGITGKDDEEYDPSWMDFDTWKGDKFDDS